MSKSTLPPLHTVIPPLICGTATFNNLYNTNVSALPTDQIIHQALEAGVTAFDTSPYYGPSEELLGRALASSSHPRASYTLITKCGRIAASEFDYSPAWLSYSITRSLARLHTSYIDVLYLHDVEFVSADEVLVAIAHLRHLRDTQGTLRYIGISGYPVGLLCDLAERVLAETGEPLDAVMSYANFTVQNQELKERGMARLVAAGVQVVPNASVLGMGLLRAVGVPVGGKGDFHPAPAELRSAVHEAAEFVKARGEKLEVVSIRWSLDAWARQGSATAGAGIGVSVMGVSNLAELDETLRVWHSVLDGLDYKGREVKQEEREWSVRRAAEVNEMVEGIWKILGKWRGYTWASPDEGYVNVRVVKGVVDEEAPSPEVTGKEVGLESSR